MATHPLEVVKDVKAIEKRDTLEKSAYNTEYMR